MFELKKIGIVKRASAWLLDAILLAVLTTGFMYLISLICDFDGVQQTYAEYSAEWDGFRKDYMPALAERYGYVYEEQEDGLLVITKNGQDAVLDDIMKEFVEENGTVEEAYEAYSALPPSPDGSEEWARFRAKYLPAVAKAYGFLYRETADGAVVVTTAEGEEASLDDVLNAFSAAGGKVEATAEAYAQYKLLTPAGKVSAHLRYLFALLFMMLSIGLLLAYLILEFVLPLFFKNGQTVGKKVFGVGLVRQDCVKISGVMLFTRTLVGKFAIETMFPLLMIYLFFFGGLGLLAVILLAAIVLLNVVLFFATHNHTPIHDILARTVAVDIKLQMIYRSEDELTEKKTLEHSESVKHIKS